MFGEKTKRALLIIHHLEENVSSWFWSGSLKSLHKTVEHPKTQDEIVAKDIIEKHWNKLNTY